MSLFSDQALRVLLSYFTGAQIQQFVHHEVTPDLWLDLSDDNFAELGVFELSQRQNFRIWAQTNSEFCRKTLVNKETDVKPSLKMIEAESPTPRKENAWTSLQPTPANKTTINAFDNSIWKYKK